MCSICIDVLYTTSYLSWGVPPRIFGEIRIAHLVRFFLCCPSMCLYVLSSVLGCPLRFLHAKNVQFISTSSCLHESSCLIHLVSVCLHVVLFNTYCVVFFFVCVPYVASFSWLSFFYIAPSVFSNVYLHILPLTCTYM